MCLIVYSRSESSTDSLSVFMYVNELYFIGHCPDSLYTCTIKDWLPRNVEMG